MRHFVFEHSTISNIVHLHATVKEISLPLLNVCVESSRQSVRTDYYTKSDT